MAKLARAVILRDPNKARDLHFQPGEEPAPEYAVLIRNPACWEGGKLPTAVKRAITAQDKDEADSSTTAKATPGGEADPTDNSQDTNSGDESSDADQQEDSEKAPAAKKTAARKTAATSRSRGRDAADEGTSGE